MIINFQNSFVILRLSDMKYPPVCLTFKAFACEAGETNTLLHCHMMDLPYAEIRYKAPDPRASVRTVTLQV